MKNTDIQSPEAEDCFDGQSLFEMCSLSTDETHLPVVVWISIRPAKTKIPRIMFSNVRSTDLTPRNLVPLSISESPEILTSDTKLNIHRRMFEAVREWGAENRHGLLKVWDGEISPAEFVKSEMKKIHICKWATPEDEKTLSDVMKELYRESYRNAPKVIVAGGRDFDDYGYMSGKLDELFFASGTFESPIKIISGMADGTDTLAIRYADEREMTKILFPANWKEHPRMAGILRNEDMLSIATHLVAFWDGKSHGTKHMIEIAREKGIPVWVFEYHTDGY